MFWDAIASVKGLCTVNVLDGFAAAVVRQLLATGRMEVSPGARAQVVLFVANYLRKEGAGRSLVSATIQALLLCSEVEEVYADDAELKELITDLGLQ